MVGFEITPQSKTIWPMYSDTNDSWCRPAHPLPSASKYILSKPSIGPMSDVEQAPFHTPWGKIYIHETEVTAWLSVLVWL